MNLQVTFLLSPAEVAANEAFKRGPRYLRADGDIDIKAVLMEFRRRLARNHLRNPDGIMNDLNCEVVAEQARWASEQAEAEFRHRLAEEGK